MHQRRSVEKSQIDFMGEGLGHHLSCHWDAETRVPVGICRLDRRLDREGVGVSMCSCAHVLSSAV